MKWLVVLLATVVAAFSGLFALASTMSFNSPDSVERGQARACSFWAFLLTSGCLVLISITLSGCKSVETLIDACRDGACR